MPLFSLMQVVGFLMTWLISNFITAQMVFTIKYSVSISFTFLNKNVIGVYYWREEERNNAVYWKSCTVNI